MDERVLLRAEKLKCQLLEVINLGSDDKHDKIANAFSKYKKYCYKYGIKDTFPVMDYLNCSYVVESEPFLFDVDEEAVREVVARLKMAMEANKEGLVDGISIEDAYLLLDWSVQNARKQFIRDGVDVVHDSLMGSCGYSQALTTMPLMNLGLKTTINNVSGLPVAGYRHAYSTVTIPIKEDNGCYYQQFLIDATYRQFYQSVMCNDGWFYSTDERLKDNVGPSAGYYVPRDDFGLVFARKLLKRGFIELTENTAKYYAYGFACERLNLRNFDKIHDFAQMSGKDVIKAINEVQEELDYDPEEIISYGSPIYVPGDERTYISSKNGNAITGGNEDEERGL